MGARCLLFNVEGNPVASIREKQQGSLDTSGSSEFVFTRDKGKWSVPFAKINKMVYREKVGRHVAATVATTVAVGVSGLFVLMAKKKKHCLNLEWNDESGDKATKRYYGDATCKATTPGRGTLRADQVKKQLGSPQNMWLKN